MHVKENTSIVQSNFLIENRPKLTIDETRLFLTVIGAINKDDEEFKPLEIPVMEFADLWGIETKTAYNKIKIALCSLGKKNFFVEGIDPKTEKMRFFNVQCISGSTYGEGEGYAIVEIAQMFKPHLLALKKNYTRYILENIMNLSTVNAIRNYEILKQYETIGSRTFSVEEYKQILQIDNKYSRNTDLRINVIDAAVEEINTNTDILISYEIIGRGKKAKIVFTILPNKHIKPHLEKLPEGETSEPTNTEPLKVDEFAKDFSQNPIELTFQTEDDRENYIYNYTHTTWKQCRDIDWEFIDIEKLAFLAEYIPENVHKYNVNYVFAIYAVLRRHIPVDQSMPDLWCVDRIMEFNCQEWFPAKRDKTEYSLGGYYKSNLTYWLDANFPKEQ